MKNTMNNQNPDQNTNVAFTSNVSASVVGLVGMVAETENLVVRNQNPLPLGLLKAVTKSETTTKTNPVKSYNNSKLNTGHQGICKLSEAEVTATQICWLGSKLTTLSQLDLTNNTSSSRGSR